MRKNTQRVLALAGMTLAAGVAFGMNTASAFAADTGTTQSAHDPHDGGWGNDNNWGHDDNWGHDNGWGHDDNWGHDNGWHHTVTRTAGYFRTMRGCQIQGAIGRHRGYWDQYRCVALNHGRTYALVVTGHRGGWSDHR